MTAQTGGEFLTLARSTSKHCLGAEATSKTCPACGGDCWRVGLVDLAYTFEVCSCGDPTYPHLYEQLHHRKCLITGEPA